MTMPALPARCLDRCELADLVDTLAGRPDLWSDEVSYADRQRHYASIHRDEYVDIWLICWSPGNDTGWHDHDISSGAVRVIKGALVESNPRIGGIHARTVVAEGCSFSFGPDHIHRLTDETTQAISLHAYSPPLWRLGQYTIGDDGVMRRLSVSYADELRPLDSPPAVPTAERSQRGLPARSASLRDARLRRLLYPNEVRRPGAERAPLLLAFPI